MTARRAHGCAKARVSQRAVGRSDRLGRPQNGLSGHHYTGKRRGWSRVCGSQKEARLPRNCSRIELTREPRLGSWQEEALGRLIGVLPIGEHHTSAVVSVAWCRREVASLRGGE